MSISDWSSDVCSSDLPDGLAPAIANYAEWRAHILDRLRRQVAVTADPVLVALMAELAAYPAPGRSDERRVGKECVRTCRSRWSPYPSNKKKANELENLCSTGIGHKQHNKHKHL